MSRKMHETICMVCKKVFLVATWRIGKAKFCSYDCYNKDRTTKKSYHNKRKCKGCGIAFLPTNWYQKWCNRNCFLSSQKKKTTILKCLICGKEFRQTRKEQKYCSRECGHPYKDNYIKKPKQEALDRLWSQLIKIRARNKCEYCGKDHGLNSHHVFSRSNRQVRWDVDNGVCVCVGHHVFNLISAHKAPIEFIEWLKEMRGDGWYFRLREKSRGTKKIDDTCKETIRDGLKKQIAEVELCAKM